MSAYQDMYWKEMLQLKGHICYLGAHHRHDEKIDTWIAGLCAVAASSGIASWAIWEGLGFVWGTIIAVSQVLSALKPHLPFSSRATATGKAMSQLELLFCRAETGWYEVAEGLLSDQEIHQKTSELKTAKNEICERCLSTKTIPRVAQFLNEANVEATRYFQLTYGV